MTPDVLKAWREGMGWTQLRASAELGITQASYNAMENGRAKISRRTALACMALRWLEPAYLPI